MFYNRNGSSLLKKFVDKQFRAWKHEDIAYKAAFLGRMRTAMNQFYQTHKKYPDADELDKMQDKLYDEVNQLDTDEHWEINKANSLEQLFNILNVLHKKARTKELVINKRYEELSKVTALIDPDKFPIFNLLERLDDQDLVSIWEYRTELMKEVAEELGFSLKVKQSKIEHHEAGDGVFLECTNTERKVTRGTLLGIVPGLIHSSYEAPVHENKFVEKPFLTCYDETYVNFSASLPYPLKFGYSLDEYYTNRDMMNDLRGESNFFPEVPGEYFNPYALGHMINHPPPETAVNVALLDIIIPNTFFPDYLLRYLPYIKHSSDKAAKYLREYYHNHCYHGLGIIALEEIEDGQELYCDYFDHSRYSMHFTPDWLVRPPPLSPYLTKYQYEQDFTFLARIIDSYLISKQMDVYESYMKRTSAEPSSQELLKKTVLKDRIKNKQEKESKKQSA